jgi:predicted secreted hydrolase
MEVTGFTKATQGRPLEFPADFGPHPDFLSEWWYYTGNLTAESGEHFGYQLTIFRRALLPADQIVERASTWVAKQVYFAHFTLTDVARGEHRAFERFARGAADLAGAQAAPYQVWLEDWRIDQIEENTYRLQASQEDIALDLTLIDRKGPILQGEQGYSPKGPDPGNASYYYSQTNMQTSGLVKSAGREYQVRGKSWMDHEFSTSALSADQVGWDWFSIQLDDDTELMLFHIRKEDGSIDPVSSGILVRDDGSTLKFRKDDFKIDVQDEWRSPESGVAYPAKWAIFIPKIDLTLELEPLVPDQELNVSFVYWEGAVQIRGQKDGLPVTGFGYVEMTGYAGSMADQF